MAIKATIKQPGRLTAKSVAVSPPVKFTDMTDVDSSQLSDGAMIIYEASTQKFSVRTDVDNPNTKIIGGSF